MENELKKLKDKALSEIKKIDAVKELDEIKNKYFSRKSGEINKILKDLKSLPDDIKPKMGAMANKIKKDVEDEINKRMKSLSKDLVKELEEQEWLDTTVSIDKYRLGHLHPITQTIYELEDIFSSMGFNIETGPELESDFFNFEAMNMPSWHPARESQDTFFIEDLNSGKLVLRTQTSPVQVRSLQKYGAPLKVVVPGRVFRNEATDASHDHTFYQLEGLMVDKNISIANLVAVMKEAISAIFKTEVELRLRPGYFPFVEPGFEMDFKCLICQGEGCSVCKHTGWVEFLGSGLVHPNVLEYGKIDPKEYQGFAFGMGLDRLVMMRYEIDDIRHFHSGDLRFLNQF